MKAGMGERLAGGCGGTSHRCSLKSWRGGSRRWPRDQVLPDLLEVSWLESSKPPLPPLQHQQQLRNSPQPPHVVMDWKASKCGAFFVLMT